MTNPEKIVTDSKIIMDYLGYWPNFHDAEIIELRMERNSPSIIIRFHLFGYAESVDGKGISIVNKECNADIVFDRVSEVQFIGFNHQNSIFEIIFEEREDGIEVIINTNHGLEGSFMCKTIKVNELVDIKDRF